ncbi:MAG TPA: bifunctional phosphopantothenoylcysteine decarboxylase/phosphopantothenate--cysteine ligase CoaBC [Kiritimatiellae bacterium]|nr:bifunctional phosphopantothenoylcysteine decarboxylase/phosphopantothenate--cysteine ligase CoaBC [Kiritimatiellia bacterium]
MNTSAPDQVKGRRPLVLCAVCGGISAYKTAEVVSRLVQRDDSRVRVIMSRNACKFVTPLTFRALTGAPVSVSLFSRSADAPDHPIFPHIDLAGEADIFLLAPATADAIARIARGHAGDLVAAAALALPADCIRVFCPAMNSAMWLSPPTQENVRRLENLGWLRLGPRAGRLACGGQGMGRMAQPDEITACIAGCLKRRASLSGSTILICSGPTREYLDPVRFISNASSGLTGKSLAMEAVVRGAAVIFITGPVCPDHLPRHPRIVHVQVTTAAEMLEAALAHTPQANAYIFTAAVADFAPAQTLPQKQPRGPGITLNLHPTEDVAAAVSARRRPGTVAVGFALQDSLEDPSAEEKLRAKHLDAIVVDTAAAMEAYSARYRFIWHEEGALRHADWGTLDKPTCARRVLDWISEQIS